MMGTEEGTRIQVLRSYEILGTAPESAFDDVTAICADLLDVPFVLVTLIDAKRQWFKSRVGVALEQTQRSIAFCDHASRRDGPLIVEDLCQDTRFASNPLVVKDPCLRFYASMPLTTPDGVKLGTLCAIDTEPRGFDDGQLRLLIRLVHQVQVELELRRQTLVLTRQLASCSAGRSQQEMFAAMLVHDMRSPLTAIALSAAAGLHEPLAKDCLREISAAVEWAQRLVADGLDLCIARTGGLTPRRATILVSALLERAVAAVARSAADRRIELRVNDPGPGATCTLDPEMIGRALINLLENAIRFSPRDETVTLAVECESAGSTFSVADLGPGIAPEERLRVFEPFVSLEAGTHHRGLGLAFCKTAADAHGGRVWFDDVPSCGSRLQLYIPSGGCAT